MKEIAEDLFIYVNAYIENELDRRGRKKRHPSKAIIINILARKLRKANPKDTK